MISRLLKQILEDRRFMFVLGLFFLGLALGSFSVEEFRVYLASIFRTTSENNFVTFTTLLLSVVAFGLGYLQSGGNETIEEKTYNKVMSQLKRQNNHYASISKEISDYKEEVASNLEASKKESERSKSDIEKILQRLNDFELNANLSTDDKSKIIESIVDRSSEQSIKDIFNNEAKLLRAEVKKSLAYEKLSQDSETTIHRLYREISDLRLRANINLIIGMAITAGGLYLLWTTVLMVDSSELLKQLASEGQESNTKFIKNLVLPILPRVMLIIFVEIFAYFFLRLYKNGLEEIKYFQNELTNVESKLSAVNYALATGNEDALQVSITSLAHTERNFVLEKGQTTVELEKAKSESELTRNIIKTVPNIFKQIGK
ncbi:hypothetical protein [Vibrio coralliilyticus]|uniref:hypothetical protein n=1 Tax=Vibrio coralliilyticus TaxID=190893 RepID=UPI001E3B3074|nr:hypothetical protein [Vibrio coralliilyticus]MCC2522197.1 hypothetical protein [Vibrio coralliilyticus]